VEKNSEIISAALRAHTERAIANGQTINQLAIAAEVERATLTRWMKGERTITLATADKLAKYFKLAVIAKRRKGRDNG
jgi:plasmid maintenance system antidote protein VapI